MQELSALLAAILTVISAFFGPAKTAPLNTGPIVNQSVTQTSAVATLSIVPKEINVGVGKTSSFDIKISADSPDISAIAIRMHYPFGGNTPALSTLDALPAKPGIQAGINPGLAADNWSYPVNDFSLNNNNKIATLDLALVHMSPTGFHFESGTTLATVNFQTVSPGNLTLNFDLSDTKVIDKKGEELPLITQKGIINIK